MSLRRTVLVLLVRGRRFVISKVVALPWGTTVGMAMDPSEEGIDGTGGEMA